MCGGPIFWARFFEKEIALDIDPHQNGTLIVSMGRAYSGELIPRESGEDRFVRHACLRDSRRPPAIKQTARPAKL